MPLLKHAKKKMRQDKKRTLRNKRVKTVFRELLKKAKQAQTPEALGAAFSSLDRAAKDHIIHANKAARLKSSLSKLVASNNPAVAVKTPAPKKASARASRVKSTKKAAK